MTADLLRKIAAAAVALAVALLTGLILAGRWLMASRRLGQRRT